MKYLVRGNFLFFIFFSLWSCGQKPSGSVATAAKKPNILLCIADDASFPHMGAYGTSWIKTPAFDRIAKEGILFTRAYTPNAKCSPSRACILTGRNSWQLEEAANHSPDFPAKFKTFMEALGENGYFTGYTQKGWAPGNSGQVNGRKRELTGKPYNKRTLHAPTKGIAANNYAENFRDFLIEKPSDEPFCFWFGSSEPHRVYEYGSSLRNGKSKEQVNSVPAYWPDSDTVRTDILDYAFELEYFDSHLAKMLQILEEKGELENTFILVTSDNGMPFPRAKGFAYEISNHLPLAIMWKGGLKNPGRTVHDFVSFIDFAPTFLELAGLSPEKAGMQPVTGISLTDIIFSQKEGMVNPERNYVLIGQERHDVGRPQDWGYPIRGLVQGEYLYIKNYEPSRWPAGNPETGYLNTDGGATKTYILNMRRRGEMPEYWQFNFGKRVAEELYNLREDPDCMKNLVTDAKYTDLTTQTRAQMEGKLRQQGDPRIYGKGDIFEQYPYSGEVKGFYERYRGGEKVNAGWVNESDFEKEPLDNKQPGN